MKNNRKNIYLTDKIARKASCRSPILSYNILVDLYKLEHGHEGNVIPCYQDTENPRNVAVDRVISTAMMVHAILWPSLGMTISLTGCGIFWWLNNGKLNRLFIYNSFGPN